LIMKCASVCAFQALELTLKSKLIKHFLLAYPFNITA
jgi:hypothetical protein